MLSVRRPGRASWSLPMASSRGRWYRAAWQVLPSQSPQDQKPFQATRQCSLPAFSQKQFLDVLRELWPSSCDNTSWNYKEIFCGQPAPANSLWVAELPLALPFLDSPLTPVHSVQDNLGS